MIKMRTNALMQIIPIEIRAMFLLFSWKLFSGIFLVSVGKLCSSSTELSGAILRVISGLISSPLDSTEFMLWYSSRGTKRFLLSRTSMSGREIISSLIWIILGEGVLLCSRNFIRMVFETSCRGIKDSSKIVDLRLLSLILNIGFQLDN